MERKEVGIICPKCETKTLLIYDEPENRMDNEPKMVIGVRCSCGETITHQV